MAESDQDVFISDAEDDQPAIDHQEDSFLSDQEVQSHSEQSDNDQEEIGNVELSLEEQLLLTARNGDYEAVRLLLSQVESGDITLDINCIGNQKSNRGWTALHLSTYFGHTDAVKVLLEHGANVNVVNSNGDTPLHKAAFTGRVETLTLLLNYGADISLVNDEGKTPQMVSKTKEIKALINAAHSHEKLRKREDFVSSIRSGDVDYLQEMLRDKKPLDINATDQYGNTALHIAAQANQTEVAVLLLQSGINSTLKNNNDQTAADFARTNQMKQILAGVRPVQELCIQPQRCEGQLLKRSRFFGYKSVWVVLERGVLSYFKNRGDASTGSKRKGMKYLDEAKLYISEKNPVEFVIHYSDGATHVFSTQDDLEDTISRQKWLNALKLHVSYSTHYIHQGEAQNDKDEVVPLGSLKDALQTAHAHQKLLEKETGQLSFVVSSLENDGPLNKQGTLEDVRQKLQKISVLSKDTCASLSHCLTLFTQQEEVRNLQLKEEMEKSRVLQEALHALATEHHELEQSISGRKSPARYYDTDDDEFYECDEDSYDSTNDKDIAESFKSTIDNNSFQSSSPYLPPPQTADGDLNGLVKSKYGRTKLPVPMFDRNDFSIWSILKQCIGKELSKITMPVVFNEPISFIQRISEYMEYTSLLEKASLTDDPVERMTYVSAFAVSAVSSNWERIGKPFNPLLGETFELDRPDLGFRLVGEQVSHHPPVSAFQVESLHFKVHGSIHPKLRFWGKSVEVNPKGTITLELTRHGEVYTWSNVNCCVHNVIVGKLWVEHYGVMEVTNHKTQWKSVLNFKQGGWFAKDLHRVEGFIYDKKKTKRKALYGSWVLDLYSVDVDAYENFMKTYNGSSPSHTAKTNGASGSAEVHEEMPSRRLSSYDLCIPGQKCVWQSHPRPEKSTQYFHFTLFAMALNEITPDLAGKLSPTDARLRPDIRLLEEGQIDAAASEKNRIEEKQRAARKERKKKKEEWTPVWFKMDINPYTGKEDWMFKGNYWERDWSKCPDIF